MTTPGRHLLINKFLLVQHRGPLMGVELEGSNLDLDHLYFF